MFTVASCLLKFIVGAVIRILYSEVARIIEVYWQAIVENTCNRMRQIAVYDLCKLQNKGKD